jgi:predicted O-methyltransferase YrrM
MNKQERIEQLFVTPRMGHAELTENNSVRGLYIMAERHFKPDFKLAEIGSFQGVSTMLFANLVDTVYSIDCYDYHVPPSGRIPEMDAMFIEAEKIFNDRIKDYNNIIKIKKTSIEAAKDFEDNSLDAVYIDGEHLYDYIRADVQAWKDKIKDGGILCGHDYDHNHSMSIDKILREFGLVNKFTVYPDTSWSVVIKRS